jgi:hypothetical protein
MRVTHYLSVIATNIVIDTLSIGRGTTATEDNVHQSVKIPMIYPALVRSHSRHLMIRDDGGSWSD